LNLREKVPIPLPRSLVRQRLAESQSWVGLEEFAADHASARKHFVASLASHPWQPRMWLYVLASFVPHVLLDFIRDAMY
jgi:hypothetical protein